MLHYVMIKSKWNITPSVWVKMSVYERMFIIAGMELHAEQVEKQNNKMKTKTSRRR